MPGLMDLLSETLGGDTTSRIGQQVGANQAATTTAIAAALPMILAALNRNASNPSGAASLHGALSRDHDGSILENLGGFLGNPQAGPGSGILGHLFGDRQENAANAIGRASGLDRTQVMALLVTLAPVVLGALGRAQRQRGLDANGLASMLGDEHTQQAQQSPDVMSMATSVLDQNKDGSIMDDVMRGVGGLFGRN